MEEFINKSPESLIKTLVEENCPQDYNPIDYVVDIVRPLAINKLNNCLTECNSCDICEHNTKTLFKSNGFEPVLFIGETALLSQKGTTYPFKGTEEESMFNKLFKAYGIDSTKIAWINVVNCCSHRIDASNKHQKRAPTSKEINECKIFLDYAIKTLNPKMIIILGNIALNVFKSDTILKAHGKFIEVKGIHAMPTYSPSYFLDMKGIKSDRDIEEDKTDFCIDMKNAFLWFNETYPEENIFLNDNIKQY